MNEQSRDGIAYYESKEAYAGQEQGLLPPGQRPIPHGPVRTPVELLNAAIARGYAAQATKRAEEISSADDGGAEIIILSDRRKLKPYSCSQCGSKGHTKAFHNPNYTGTHPVKERG